MDITKLKIARRLNSEIAEKIFDDIEKRIGCFRTLIGVSETVYSIFEELDDIRNKYINDK